MRYLLNLIESGVYPLNAIYVPGAGGGVVYIHSSEF